MGGILFSTMRSFSSTARNLREDTPRGLVTTGIWVNVVALWLGHANALGMIRTDWHRHAAIWGSWIRYLAIRAGHGGRFMNAGDFS